MAPPTDVATAKLLASVRVATPMSGPKCSNYQVLANFELRRQRLAAGKLRSNELLRQFNSTADALRAYGLTAPIPPTDVPDESLEGQTRYLGEFAAVLEAAQSTLKGREAADRAERLVRALLSSNGSDVASDSDKPLSSYDELDPDTDERASISDRVRSVRSHLSCLVGQPDATEQLSLREATSAIVSATSDAEAALHEARVESIVTRCNTRAEQVERLRTKATAILERYRGLDTATGRRHLEYAKLVEANPATIAATDLVSCDSALAEELNAINREYVQRQVVEALSASGFHPDSRITTYTPQDGKLILRHEGLGKYALMIEVERNSIRGRAVELSDSSGTAAPNTVIEEHICAVLHHITPKLASQGIHAQFIEDVSAQPGVAKVKARDKSALQSRQIQQKTLEP